MLKKYLTAAIVAFLVIFNIGFLFHDILLGNWFANQLSGIAREHYIIPLIGVSYLIYMLIAAYIYPAFYSYYKLSVLKSGILFGALMGIMYDFLEGGIIEYATLKIPFSAIIVDSSYHFFEGILAGVIIALIYGKIPRKN